MLKVLLMAALASIGMVLFNGARLLYYLILGRKCTVTLGDIKKKEIPCYEDEKKVKYIYYAEVDLNGEKIQSTYEDIMSPQEAAEYPVGTIKHMRYNRSSDTLYDWNEAKQGFFLPLIFCGAMVFLFWLIAFI